MHSPPHDDEQQQTPALAPQNDTPPFPDSHPVTGSLYGPPEGALATSHVGNYTLYGTIGEGAFGKVKIAVHRGSNVRVAIKIMDKGEIRAQEFTAQVRREIYIMRRLKHRHIVRMYEVLTSDTKLYIVMELVTGGELFDRIEKGRVPEDKARQYFQQLVDGVDFCHKKGVAHRDLKPENLLVDENGEIKITDFGFSSMKGMDVNTGLLYTQCGTPDYCAPEIIDSAQNGYTGAKVDAWSCGIILYALLCGRLPFQEHDTEKLYDLILACSVKYPAFISHSARDLLSNLLVRDPNKRFDLQKVKRHPWFLVNYEGDDARLIKKRPFFNKNQKDLTGSGPSSPMAVVMPDDTTSTPMTSGPYPPSSPPPSDQSLDRQRPPPIPTTSTEAPRQADVLVHQPPQQITEAGNPRSVPAGSRPLPAIARLRDEAQGGYRPSSPASLDSHVRAPTPPAHDVFTRVQDRPATPARRQTSASTAAAFKAAAAAASAAVPDTATNGHAGTNSSKYSSLSHSRLSPDGEASPHVPLPNGVPSATVSPAAFPKPPDLHLRGDNENDDSSSEQDSTEDYEEKPAPTLEMPSDPRQLLRLTKEGRRQIQSLPHPKTMRQRSDLAGAIVNGSYPISSSPLDHGSASLSALQRPRRAFTRDGADSGNVSDARSARIARTPDIPGSPPVVYSPSSMDGPSYDRLRSASPGFNALRSGLATEGSPNGVYHPGLSGSQHPWQSHNSGGYASSRDDVTNNNATPMSLQIEILLRHHWSLLCKWRGSSEPASPKLSQELRQDIRLFLNEMKQINRLEDKANLFTNFLYMFEHLALSDAPVSSPGFGSQNTDEEYETGPDSREEGSSMNGDMRAGNTRLAVTDISSEEEPLSWSPVVADANGPQTSDLARRRDLSDLLNRWIHRTDNASTIRTEEAADGEDSTQVVDLMELQRLMREHHGGREESNLADDLLRMMNSSDDGGSAAFSTLSTLPGQSPPPPHAARSVDAYLQSSRYPSGGASNGGIGRPNPIRSVSSNNTPLPSEYVPGRFREPNSMPARVRNGNDRMTSLGGRGGGRGDGNDVGDTVGGGRNMENMANSMGMNDVAYYSSDRRSGMANKLRGVLQTMKAKNHRLGESHAQFKSNLPPEIIMRVLGRVLQGMGAGVQVKKETKRKMKCQLPMAGWTLCAGIELTELTGAEEGITSVSFRRSKADRGKTDTESFHNFYERVRSGFIKEASTQYPSSRLATSSAPSRRRRNNDTTSRHVVDDSSGLSAAT